MRDMLRAVQKGKNSLGMFIKEGRAFYVLNFKGAHSEIDSHKSLKDLPVTILHKLIFERLLRIDEFEYEMNPELVVEKVANGPFHAAFFLNPTTVQDIRAISQAGEKMPGKATYFYPKLLTGLVFNQMVEP